MEPTVYPNPGTCSIPAGPSESDEATFIIPPEGHKAMVYGFVRSQNELYGTDIDPEEVWQAVLAGLEENE